jgi:hypothetical protein
MRRPSALMAKRCLGQLRTTSISSAGEMLRPAAWAPRSNASMGTQPWASRASPARPGLWRRTRLMNLLVDVSVFLLFIGSISMDFVFLS